MKILQATIHDAQTLRQQVVPLVAMNPDLVLVFAAPAFFAEASCMQALPELFAKSSLLGCSTAGEIAQAGVMENSAVVTAIHFDKSTVVASSTELAGMADSFAAGERLAAGLAGPRLRAALVFSRGVEVNGSALIEGMVKVLGSEVMIVGGLAGDNGAFKQTWTLGKNGVSDRAVVAVGLAGEQLRVGHGSFGGWQAFGPSRCVTRCDGNVLHELDGEPALSVYKRYLGDYARDLPASGLLFPFEMIEDETDNGPLIRTILGIDEQQGTLTLAGAIREGGMLKLMHASTDALVDGSVIAAEKVSEMIGQTGPALGLLVSCVGRKLVMGDRVEEEYEAAQRVLGDQVTCTGFYSYGEIGPVNPGAACQLNNQTMTISVITESD
jgi:hypothetical protein